MGDSTTIDLDGWDAGFRVNVKSMIMMARYAIPEMRKVGKGAIVNMSSTSGCKRSLHLTISPLDADVGMISLGRGWCFAISYYKGRSDTDDQSYGCTAWT
jgi:hypothetical protein